MKNLYCISVVIFVILNVNTNLYSQDVIDSSAIKSIQVYYKVTQQEIDKLNSAVNVQIQTSNKKIDSLTKAISNAGNSESKIRYINEKTIEIESKLRTKEENILVLREKRYIAGKAAITTMKNGVGIISFTQKILDLEHYIDASTNLWADSNVSNGWNKIEDWGMALGLVIAISTGLSLDDQGDKVSGVAAGAGIAGLSKIVGNVFGMSEKKIRQKMERIDLSKRAYDDMIMRNRQLQIFLEKNKNFEEKISKFEIEYNSATEEQKSLMTAKLIDLLDEYKYVLRQIPDYLDQISSVSYSYINSSKYKELPMKEIFDNVVSRCNEVKDEFNKKVLPIIIVSPDIKKSILDIY